MPANKATLAAAVALDAEERGKDTAEWTLLQRGVTTDANFFLDHVRPSVAKLGGGVTAKLTAKTTRKHSAAILSVLSLARSRDEPLPFLWDATWLTLLAQHDPHTVLHLLLIAFEAPNKDGPTGATAVRPEEEAWQRRRQAALDAAPKHDPHDPQVRGGQRRQSEPPLALLLELIRWACRTNFGILLGVLTSRAVLTISRHEILKVICASPKATWREKRNAVIGTFLAFDRRGQRQALRSLLTTHYSPITAHQSSLTTHFSSLTIYHLPLTTHHSLPTTYYSPLITHSYLITNSLVITHDCSLLTSHYPLLFTGAYCSLPTSHTPFLHLQGAARLRLPSSSRRLAKKGRRSRFPPRRILADGW